MIKALGHVPHHDMSQVANPQCQVGVLSLQRLAHGVMNLPTFSPCNPVRVYSPSWKAPRSQWGDGAINVG